MVSVSCLGRTVLGWPLVARGNGPTMAVENGNTCLVHMDLCDRIGVFAMARMAIARLASFTACSKEPGAIAGGVLDFNLAFIIIESYSRIYCVARNGGL